MPQASDQAYDHLRQAILTGVLARGERIREAAVAREIGVSRTPIREALRRLQTEGLVEFSANRGAQVSTWSRKDLAELYELRALVEGYGARLATASITDEEVEALTSVAERMEALVATQRVDVSEVTRLNSEFHHRVLAAAQNDQVINLAASLQNVPLMHQTFDHYDSAEMQRSLMQHREILQALTQRDGSWAESTMRSHILAGRATLLETLDLDGLGADDRKGN